MTRPKKQCGLALVFNFKRKKTEVVGGHWCILDRWPRHSFHLLMQTETALALTPSQRADAIRKFDRLVAKSKSGARR